MTSAHAQLGTSLRFRLVNCIHDNEASPESSVGSRDELRIEAAHVLASLAYGA